MPGITWQQRRAKAVKAAAAAMAPGQKAAHRLVVSWLKSLQSESVCTRDGNQAFKQRQSRHGAWAGELRQHGRAQPAGVDAHMLRAFRA